MKSWNNKKAYVRVSLSVAPFGANIIGSHTIFKIKDDNSVKARIVPWDIETTKKTNFDQTHLASMSKYFDESCPSQRNSIGY